MSTDVMFELRSWLLRTRRTWATDTLTIRLVGWWVCLVLATSAFGFGIASLLDGFNQPPRQNVWSPYVDPYEVLHVITGKVQLSSIEVVDPRPTEAPMHHALESIPSLIAKDFARFASTAKPPTPIGEADAARYIQQRLDQIGDRQFRYGFAIGLVKTERALLRHEEILTLAEHSSPNAVLGTIFETYDLYFMHKLRKEAELVDEAIKAHSLQVRASECYLLISLALMASLTFFMGLKLWRRPHA